MYRLVLSKIFTNSKKNLKVLLNDAKNKSFSTRENYVNVNDVNGVREITLASPKTRNALSIPMMDEIHKEIIDVTNNEDIRCIKISAIGPVFSSGHNLKDLANGNEKLYIDTFTKCADLMLSIIEAPVPVIAIINGVAAAAGCQLVATCDIVIASEKSTFSTPGANFGIFCSTPGIALSRCVNKKIAAHMLLTGLPLNAHEALQFGLVSKICDESELDIEADLRINAIKSKSRSVIELGKKFFYSQLEKDIHSAYSLGSQVMTDNLKLVDGQEGLKSFLEKRHPSWKNNFSISEKFQ